MMEEIESLLFLKAVAQEYFEILEALGEVKADYLNQAVNESVTVLTVAISRLLKYDKALAGKRLTVPAKEKLYGEENIENSEYRIYEEDIKEAINKLGTLEDIYNETEENKTNEN